MDERTVGQVEEWDSRPFEGGYDGLHNLADDGFTGAVTAAGAWLFMLNGRVIGVFNGRLDDFEHGSGTTYRAPHPSLPLLFTMLEQGGETRAQYFTDDTPIDEVDGTLTEANFTGYLELSENVLSGDYYVAYYGGRSLSAAFVGNSAQLITGDEAFQRAVDEVGIYEVNDVDLEIHDLPERSSPTAAASDTGGSSDAEPADADTSTPDSTPTTEPTAGTEPPEAEPADASPDDTASATAPEEGDVSTDTAADATADPGSPTEQAESDPHSTTESDAGSAPDSADRPADADATATPDTADASADATGSSSPADAGPDQSAGQRSPDRTDQPAASGGTSTDSAPSADPEPNEPAPEPSEDDAPEGGESPFSEEEEWRETRDVPALDPSESEPSDDSMADPDGPSQPQQASQNRPSEPAAQGADAATSNQTQPDTTPEDSQETANAASQSQASEDSGPIRADNAEKIRTLRTQLEERTAELESLREDLATAKEERDQLREERDRLKQRIQTLETELEEASAQAPDADPAAGMDPEEALTQTDIFIRYGSKGNATLEKAHQGEAEKDEVTANLKLEHHTRFDAESVTVDGEPFDQFLQGTMEYQFTKWIVEDLLFELQETGSHGKLQDLYDVLPRFDRSELRGTVELRTEDGEEVHETFDIVVRDRMGQPLIVVNINNSRDPATSEMMEALIEAANKVKLDNETLGAAVEVTASFFQPDALETASEATSSGLLSRDRRASFIKLNRKQGYHLCLIEARNGAFHVNVPEL